MVFNPEESIDFHGFTGPFVQYTYARIQSILRKADNRQVALESSPLQVAGSRLTEKLLPREKELIIFLEKYRNIVADAAAEMNPSLVANYVFSLAKLFNSFYVEHSVVHAENEEKRTLRLKLSIMTATIIKNGMRLLGISVPDKM